MSPTIRTPQQVDAILLSVCVANGDLAGAIDTPEMALYRRGFNAAIAAVAAAFETKPPAVDTRHVWPLLEASQ